MEKRYITIKEASDFLGVSVSTLRNWGKTGKLISERHPVNKYRLYRFSDLANFIKREGKNKNKNTRLQLVDE